MAGRLRTSFAAIPGALRLLLAVALVLGVTWAVVMPPLQGPDEISHFAYTQRLVETGDIPWFILHDPQDPRPSVSTEVGVAELYSGEGALGGNVGDRANWTTVDERLWRERDAQLQRSGRADGGFSSAMRYPPFYYLYEAIPYAAAYPGSFFDRSFAMRLANVVLLLGMVALSWLLAGEVLGPRRLLQTTAAGTVALNAQLVHLSSVVNPDAMLAVLGTAVLYLAVVLLGRGMTRGRVVWMIVLVLLSALTHKRGLPISAAGLVALSAAWWKQTRPHTRRTRIGVGTATGVAGVAGMFALAAFATGGERSLVGIRQFASYLWQFYLPRFDWMMPSVRPDWDVRDVYVDRFFGTFGQLDATLPQTVLDTVTSGVVVGLLMLVVALVVQRRAVRRQLDVVVVLVLAFVGYMAALHVEAYRTLLVNPLDPVLTGRYLLPLLALMGLAVAIVIRPLPAVLRGAAASAVLTLSLALQLAALGAVAVRFYG